MSLTLPMMGDLHWFTSAGDLLLHIFILCVAQGGDFLTASKNQGAKLVLPQGWTQQSLGESLIGPSCWESEEKGKSILILLPQCFCGLRFANAQQNMLENTLGMQAPPNSKAGPMVPSCGSNQFGVQGELVRLGTDRRAVGTVRCKISLCVTWHESLALNKRWKGGGGDWSWAWGARAVLGTEGGDSSLF